MILRPLRLLLATVLQALAIVLLCSTAQAAPTHITAQLVAPPAIPTGGEGQLALQMRPEKGWHGYWSNPGDAGLGTQFTWALPSGAQVGSPRYPVPQTLLISGMMNHIYKGEYAVLIPFTAPKDAKPGSRLPVSLKAQWLACTDEICVPESAELTTTVVIAEKVSSASPDFEIWEQSLPAPLGATAHFQLADDTVRFAIPLPASAVITSPHLFIATDKVVDYAAPQSFARKDDILLVTLPRARFSPITPQAIEAVLRLDGQGNGVSFTAKPGMVPSGGAPISDTVTDKSGLDLPPLPLLLLGALLGGLLLNIMPCVFPILSLKALSLARSGTSASHARAEGLAYTAGVVLACIALGGLLLILRAAGQQIGWAFQLQEPLVIAALLLLASVITANLLGIFEFSVPGFASQGSTKGAFATGLLAAFVATPCTGPFMATAMGAALLLPPVPALALFATLGIGIAAPFLALAFLPTVRGWLPQPGAWMNTFRRYMALPMAMTAVALAWLATRVAGSLFASLAVGLAVLLVAILALAGRRQRQGLAVGRLVIVGLAAVVLLAAVFLPRSESTPAADIESVSHAKPFSDDALNKALETGKPVFAYFTADWCLTCKVNEKVAIEREETRAAFEKAGVIVLRGDWTRRDPAITRYLTAQGAAGVPLYVWYPAGNTTAEHLPQVLTISTLVEKVCNPVACS